MKSKKEKKIKAWAVMDNEKIIRSSIYREESILWIYRKKVYAKKFLTNDKVVPVEIKIISPKKDEVGKK